MINQNRTRLLRLLVLSLFALVPSFLAAQEVDPNEVIRVNTDLVVLDAQVIDRKTRKVFGPLRKDDFEILEENVKQEIAYFGQDQLPLSILLLLDISRSVRPVIEQIGEGANNALRHLKPEDEVSVMAFADYPKLIQPFTKDRALTAGKITEASQLFIGHGTFLYEALLLATQEINKGTNPANRRAIIVISDNIPSSSDEDYFAKIHRELAESGTVVYGL
ncbi:MAG TPA: VWA domain-containing protein, partial [Pyrinomonadaceae bacterium]|nr:VWA domain-containing protein [Pyrinomonadaceae bacterium]